MTDQADQVDQADQSDQDEVMARIMTAITLHREGDPDEARRRFAEIWTEISPEGDVFHRCVLAHYMADVQGDPHDELQWDLRALEAADSLTDERAKQYHASLAVRGFYPSLHLNLAEDHRKLGDTGRAREHLTKATAALDALPDDDYGKGIRAALARLALRLPSPS